MRTILQNIRHFVQTNTAFFLLFHICVFVSSVLIFFAFGAYQNFHVMQQGVEERQRECFVYFYSNNSDGKPQSFHANHQQLAECVRLFSDEICSNIALLAVQYDLTAEDGHTEVYSRFRYRNKMYYPYTESLESLINNNAVISGFEGISVEEYNSGARIAQTPGKLVREDNQIYLNGQLYEAKILTKVGSVNIPFPSMPDDTELKMLYIQYYRPPTEQDFQQMKQSFQNVFGPQMVFQDPEPYSAGDYSYYTTIIMISVLIAIAAAANIALLYQYILEKRKRTLAILMLCGCTRKKAFRLFMTEITLMTVITFLLSALCWHILIMPNLLGLFPYIDTMNMRYMYLRAFIAMIVSCLAVTSVMCARIVFSSSIVRIQKEGLL